MERRYKAQDAYNKFRKEEETSRSIKLVLPEIFQFILEYLAVCRPEQKFAFHEFLKIFNCSSTMFDFDLKKASEAFENLEFYLITIWRNCWKPEFKEIKKYCGFYQTKIESHLKKAEEVFKLVGFVESEDCLVLNRRLNQEVILAVGFECVVASVECVMILRILSKVEAGIRPYDIIHSRQIYSGDEDKIAALLKGGSTDTTQTLYQKPACDTEVDHYKSPPLSPGDERSKLLNIPFIDDDADGKRENHSSSNFEEGTFDEHLLASMKLVSKEKVKTEEPPSPKKGSDEWSYVTDSLKKKFGEEYYGGVRGDILQNEQITRDVTKERHKTDQAITGKRKLKESLSMKDSGYVGGSSVYQNTSHEHRSELLARATGSKRSSMNKSFTQPSSFAHAQLLVSQSGHAQPYTEESQPYLQQEVSNDNEYKVDSFLDLKNAAIQPFNFSRSAPVARKISGETELFSSKPSQHARTGSHSLEDSSWTCPYCTIRNPIANTVCSVCSKTNDIRVSPSRSMDVRWAPVKCSKCTFLNQTPRNDCEICGNVIRDSQTTV